MESFNACVFQKERRSQRVVERLNLIPASLIKIVGSQRKIVKRLSRRQSCAARNESIESSEEKLLSCKNGNLRSK